MPTKKMIAELDRCAAWLKAQPHAVKTTDMANIAPREVKDPESWARRMMRKMDETGRAMADDVDSRSGGVWWVHPDFGKDHPVEAVEVAEFTDPRLTKFLSGTAVLKAMQSMNHAATYRFEDIGFRVRQMLLPRSLPKALRGGV